MSFVNMQSAVSPLISKFLSTCNYYYHDIWQIYGDPRVSNYAFFEGGPWSTLAMVAAYLYFIKVIGPEFMAHRKAFDLKKTILVYNISMVVLSAWLFIEGQSFLSINPLCPHWLSLLKIGVFCWLSHSFLNKYLFCKPWIGSTSAQSKVISFFRQLFQRKQTFLYLKKIELKKLLNNYL